MIRAAGHEIGHHGWVHENPTMLTPEQERHVLERGLEALDRIAGVRPVGYRSPAWDNSPATVSLLLEYGFEYTAADGQRLRAVSVRVSATILTTEEYRWGRPVDSWSKYRLPGIWTISRPSSMYGRGPAQCFRATCHPHRSGELAGRIRVLHTSRWSRYPDDNDVSAGDRARASPALPRRYPPLAGHPGVAFTTTGDMCATGARDANPNCLAMPVRSVPRHGKRQRPSAGCSQTFRGRRNSRGGRPPAAAARYAVCRDSPATAPWLGR